MKYDDFIKAAHPRVPPREVLNLARDAKIQALENILIKKGLVTAEEIRREQELQYDVNLGLLASLPDSFESSLPQL
jgi:hypothetical protein